MGGAVCSVAAGHGRNWGQGAVTACYGPLLLGTREILGKVTPLIEFRNENAKGSIPSTLLSLVRPIIATDVTAEVTCYNSGDSPVKFAWTLHRDVDVLEKKTEEAVWYEETLASQEIRKRIL